MTIAGTPEPAAPRPKITKSLLRTHVGLNDETFDEWSRLERIIRKDLREAAREMGLDEIRFMVDTYYSHQKTRIASTGQFRALTDSDEPRGTLAWLGLQMWHWEETIRLSLAEWCRSEPSGWAAWSQSIVGVGPVLTAGLMAHVDLEKAPTVGHLWAFAGLDPSREWGKGEKRPWNAALKTLVAFKLGESFVKVQANANDVYGQVFAAYKGKVQSQNESGKFAQYARDRAERFGKSTDARKHYTGGRLPPAHVHARARRAAVKLFLSHWHQVGLWLTMGRLAPEPYAIAHLAGHTRELPPPNLELVPGLADARREAGRPV